MSSIDPTGLISDELLAVILDPRCSAVCLPLLSAQVTNKIGDGVIEIENLIAPQDGFPQSSWRGDANSGQFIRTDYIDGIPVIMESGDASRKIDLLPKTGFTGTVLNRPSATTQGNTLAVRVKLETDIIGNIMSAGDADTGLYQKTGPRGTTVAKFQTSHDIDNSGNWLLINPSVSFPEDTVIMSGIDLATFEEFIMVKTDDPDHATNAGRYVIPEASRGIIPAHYNDVSFLGMLNGGGYGADQGLACGLVIDVPLSRADAETAAYRRKVFAALANMGPAVTQAS